MKPTPAITVLLILLAGAARATEGHFLNIALLRVPEIFLADVPVGSRHRLLELLSEWPGSADHLDYENGWVHWFYDGPPEDSPGATSMFWMKMLPRKEQSPLIFVHMAKPFATGAAPAPNQTVVLERGSLGRWIDVTSNVLPADLDLTMHFRPRRKEALIEVARYEKIERKDGRGQAFKFGERTLDLVWEDGRFRTQAPDGHKLSAADGTKAPE